MKSYFNTNAENGGALSVSKERAIRQQNRILSFFMSFPGQNFTPEEIHKALYGDNTPLTSVRRAITNLTQAGKLVKTDDMKVSSFGKKTHSWRCTSIRKELYS
jgi:hypothetical protein